MTNLKPLCLGIKELLKETRELISPVLAQFFSTYEKTYAAQQAD